MSVLIEPGRLTQRVTVQKRTGRSDAAGAATEPAWSDVATVWAEVLPQSGREFWRAVQTYADLTHLVRIRYRSDLTVGAAYRLKLGTRVLELLGPPADVDEAHVVWQFACKEKV